MKIEVMERIVYGRPIYYPVNALANLLCDLLHSKSLSKTQLDLCHEKGLEITVDRPKSKWG